jgi:hypothetical protein
MYTETGGARQANRAPKHSTGELVTVGPAVQLWDKHVAEYTT